MTTALMVIALQKDQTWRYSRRTKLARVLQTNRRLVRVFGKRHLPIVVITKRRPYLTKRWQAKCVQPLVAVSQYDNVMWLVTRRANALQQSQVAAFLQQAGVTRLVITGVITASFLTTVSATKQAGFKPVAVTAACIGRRVNQLTTVTTITDLLTQI